MAGKVGAGDGNRTRMISLEGWSSTIELRPLYGVVINELRIIQIRVMESTFSLFGDLEIRRGIAVH